MNCDSKFPNQVIQWIYFFLLPLGLVTSDMLKWFALLISPNLHKISLQVNITEVKIIFSVFSVLNFLNETCDSCLFFHCIL